ncbi:MAG: FAD-dependent oxidoreductase [Pseudomonadota bacterium]
MPFEHLTPVPSRRIAIVGGGISGMAAAYHLAPHAHVTLFEAAPRLGGHARTVKAGLHGDQPVDTGFIVFNRVNYPRLTTLFETLDVPLAKSDMSFAASIDGGRMEYGLRHARALFAQPGNLLRPGFRKMLRDLLRFNAEAANLADDESVTLGEFLATLGTGDWFRDYYLAPISGAIWSTPKEEILSFPAQALVRFFRNHNLMQLSGQHQWWTVRGGSIEYVKRLQAALIDRGVTLRLGQPVETVARDAGVTLRTGGAPLAFDEVIFATHADDTLRMLADPSPQESRALGAVKYQPNDAVLHADPSVMPKRRITWSSWNYVEHIDHRGGPIDLTYWMNCLQPIPENDPLFVTLNSRVQIDERRVYDRVTFRHPVYDLAALAAQKQVATLNGTQSTWYCGAWMKKGFHEDGYASAMDVVDHLTTRLQLNFEAA